MKIKHIFPAFLILVCGAFLSCEEGYLDRIGNVINYGTTTSVTFDVNETAVNPGGKTYNDTELLNVYTSEGVTYGGTVRAFRVDGLSYKISDANPNNVLFTNVTLKIVNTGKTIASASSISLANTSKTLFEHDAYSYSRLASELLAGDGETQIQLQGSLSETPVAFKLKVILDLTVSADR
jgi:hypothetical protein